MKHAYLLSRCFLKVHAFYVQHVRLSCRLVAETEQAPAALQSWMTLRPTALLAPFWMTVSPGCRATYSSSMRSAVGGLQQADGEIQLLKVYAGPIRYKSPAVPQTMKMLLVPTHRSGDYVRSMIKDAHRRQTEFVQRLLRALTTGGALDDHCCRSLDRQVARDGVHPRGVHHAGAAPRADARVQRDHRVADCKVGHLRNICVSVLQLCRLSSLPRHMKFMYSRWSPMLYSGIHEQ